MPEEAVLQEELDGQTYVLRGPVSKERLKQISGSVAQKIAAVRERSPYYSSTRTAMLVALQIAEELLALQDEYLEMLEAADIGGVELAENNRKKGE
ncbi:MAG: cell division protein ZapA [Clostridiales bacterium]|nr:cell division protein ZapA [Clostridiales bacterium]